MLSHLSSKAVLMLSNNPTISPRLSLTQGLIDIELYNCTMFLSMFEGTCQLVLRIGDKGLLKVMLLCIFAHIGRKFYTIWRIMGNF